VQRHVGPLVVDGSDRRANAVEALVAATLVRAGLVERIGNYLAPGVGRSAEPVVHIFRTDVYRHRKMSKEQIAVHVGVRAPAANGFGPIRRASMGALMMWRIDASALFVG
jgi:hypothetical protein